MRSVASLEEFVQCDDRNNDNPNSCKAYFKTKEERLYTCDQFCKDLHYTCYEAYKEESEEATCPIREGNTLGCNGPKNNDYICGCEENGKYLNYSFLKCTKICDGC